jgi:hypothetical protein
MLINLNLLHLLIQFIDFGDLINRIFAKRRNWVNIGNQAYLKLDDGSSIPLIKLAKNYKN